ncbi:hypothetical protein [Stenotrophomonas sp. RAC2]|nr:hypothetical protein [Stenotrophomonas sp. RAC2]MDV9042249.1 hypothetical protein [Stenotrophomonas sp. RAC2]
MNRYASHSAAPLESTCSGLLKGLFAQSDPTPHIQLRVIQPLPANHK